MSYPAISLTTATVVRHRCPQKRLQTARQPPVYPNSSPDHRACNSLTPLPLSSRRPSVSIGGFGVRETRVANLYQLGQGGRLSSLTLNWVNGEVTWKPDNLRIAEYESC